MKVAITGGAGFIGFHLAKFYASKGDHVTLLDNFSRSSQDHEFKELVERKNVTFHQLDITDPTAFEKLPRDFDIIFHFAAINGTGNFYTIPDKVLKVGVFGVINVLDWYSSHKHGRLVVASSSETYAGTAKILGEKFPIPTPEDVPLTIDDPSNVRWSYGASKILSEVATYSYAKARNFTDFSIIRFHNIYGPRMGTDHVIPQFIERIWKKTDPFPVFGGTETRSFCYVSDAVKACDLVGTSPKAQGKTVHIGRDDGELSILALLETLFAVGKYKAKLDIQPAPKGSVGRRCPNISLLRSLGFAPNVSLNEGLRKTLEWYLDFFNHRK